MSLPSAFFNDITEWGWPETPTRRLVFRADMPKLSRPLPRYLTPDADRRLVGPRGIAKAAGGRRPVVQRACGLRIGELLDLELDCVHEVPGKGAWLKVPLGKLATERMVPLDEETVGLLDRIVATSPAVPCPNRGPAGRRVLVPPSWQADLGGALRAELARAATSRRDTPRISSGTPMPRPL